MGNWNINIQGVGCHHNLDNPTDVNIMTKEFVKSLLAAGHIVETAVFTSGSAEHYIVPVMVGSTDKLIERPKY